MYLAPHFKNEQTSDVLQIIQDYSFATLISKDLDDEVYLSHIPILADIENDQLVNLKGHLARLNSHVDFLRVNPRATLVFHGPHTYISPKWYRSGRDVPTWNYVVVHVKGEVEFGADYRELLQTIAQTTSFYEGKGSDAWKFELPADLKDEASLMKAIISFTFKPTSIEAKFKLSQNRSILDRAGVSEGLSTRKDEMSLGIKALMDKSLKP